MDNTIDVKELFFQVSGNLTHSLKAARTQYSHHYASVGEAAEAAFRDFLSKRLPHAFAVEEGFIFEHGGKRALQQDIVIYDHLNHPLLVSEGRQGLFPVDTVVVVIEVKTNLTKKDIYDAVSKIASIKQLKRTVRNQTPGTLSKKEIIPLRGYVFAYDTNFIKARTVANHFADAVGESPPELRPDLMLVQNKWYFDWINKTREISKPLETPAALRIVHVGEYGLLQFWTRLMSHLTWYRTPIPLDWIAIPDWGSTTFKAEYLEFNT